MLILEGGNPFRSDLYIADFAFAITDDHIRRRAGPMFLQELDTPLNARLL